MSTDDGGTTEPGDAVDRAAERLDRRRGGAWTENGHGADGQPGGGEPPAGAARGDRLAAGGTGRADRLERLLLHQSAADERPYLDGLPSGYAAEHVVFDWLEFLVDRAGYRGTVGALRYYRSVGWLTERTEDRLTEYLRGFPEPATTEPLTVEDHQQSLVYVAKLSSLA
jgi:hypothetical protein